MEQPTLTPPKKKSVLPAAKSSKGTTFVFPKPTVGLASNANAMALQDPPLEPVYSMSPAMLKAGLAATLASLGIGL